MPISSRVLFCLAFFLGIFCPKGLFAKLEDHLKKIIDKGEGHQIRNVDFIYLINLDKRPEKVPPALPNFDHMELSHIDFQPSTVETSAGRPWMTAGFVLRLE